MQIKFAFALGLFVSLSFVWAGVDPFGGVYDSREERGLVRYSFSENFRFTMTPTAVLLTVLRVYRNAFRRCGNRRKAGVRHGLFTGNRENPWYVAALAMVGGGDVGHNFRVGAGVGCGRFVLLPADGAGFYRRADGDRLRADSAFLPVEGSLPVRISRRTFRYDDPPYGGLVLSYPKCSPRH